MNKHTPRPSLTHRIAVALSLVVLLSAVTVIMNSLNAQRATGNFKKFSNLSDGYLLLLDIEREASEIQRLILAYQLSPDNAVLTQLRKSLEDSNDLFRQVENSAVGAISSDLYEPMLAIFETLPEQIDNLALMAAESHKQRQTVRDAFADAIEQAVLASHSHPSIGQSTPSPAYGLIRKLYDAQIETETYLRTHAYKHQNEFSQLLLDAERINGLLFESGNENTRLMSKKLDAQISDLRREQQLLVQSDRNLIFHTNVVIAGSTTELNYLSKLIREFITIRQSESLNHVNRILEEQEQFILLGFLSLLIMALAITAWLAHKVFQPVNAVTYALDKLVSGEDVSRVPGVEREDEIGLLARAGEALYDSHLKTATLLKQSEALTRNLLSREAQLQASNAELDSFAYVASHDLRSPLRAIDNLAGWIQEDCAGILPPESEQHFDLLRRRVKRMETLLEDLLAYSRVGRLESPVEELELGEIVKEAIELINVPDHCTITLSGAMPRLTARRAPLRQVIQNLLSNAVKFNDKKEGQIDFSIGHCDDEFIEFSVSDNGPGIAPEFHEKIFALFSTLQSRDDLESSGMGLAIVKKVLKTKGGSISVDSAEGQGACFTVRWPMRPVTDDTFVEDLEEIST